MKRIGLWIIFGLVLAACGVDNSGSSAQASTTKHFQFLGTYDIPNGPNYAISVFCDSERGNLVYMAYYNHSIAVVKDGCPKVDNGNSS